jgi:F-type H+-transporting ATPase subunit a
MEEHNLLAHLEQQPLFKMEVAGVDLSITNGVVTLFAAGVLTFLFYFTVSRRLKTIPGRLQNLTEMLIIFLRDEVAAQIPARRERWLPLIIALFTFILFNNLLALVPGLGSATSNINTTAALALVVFFVVQIVGVLQHGLRGYLSTLIPHGIPLPIALFMLPVEIIGQLAKPFSLAIRLFANMFAGHAVMLMILSLIFIFKSYLILPLPVIGNAAVLAFEIFVAFIQAFIFTYLSTLYIATALEGH